MIDLRLAILEKNEACMRIIIATTKPSKAETLLAVTRLPLSVEYLSKLDLIPVDNLYMNSHCRLIARFDFNPSK